MYLNGINKIFNTFDIIFFIRFIIVTFIFIIQELKINIYIDIPIIIAKNINNRISPLLNVNIEYNNIIPVKIQNNIS